MTGEVNAEERNDSSTPLLQPSLSSLSSRVANENLGKKETSILRFLVPTIGLIFAIASYSLTIQLKGNNNVRDLVPDHPEYNEEEAVKFIQYSKIAFCTEHAIKTWSCGEMCDRAPIVGKDRIRYIPEGKRLKVQGYVAQIPTERVISGEDASPESTTPSINHDNTSDDTKCIISFRGSQNSANWYADFLAKLRPWPLNNLTGAEWCRGCKAHYGFTESYEELRLDVHKAIAELNCTRLVLAGHSLGAAVATIAAFDLRAAMGYKVETTWTYGKPRIGNAEFVNNFVAAATKQGVSPPMWRVVHYHDPVPRVPPNFPGVNPVSHGALEIYYTDRASSEYLVCPQRGAVENQSDACMGGWPL